MLVILPVICKRLYTQIGIGVTMSYLPLWQETNANNFAIDEAYILEVDVKPTNCNLFC